MGEWSGRTAVITGGGRGFGKAFGTALAAQGAHAVLVDLDGGVVTGPEGEDVMVGLEFETGRPPGSIAGDDITTTLAFRFQSLDLDPGGYKFTFNVDGAELAASRFRVLG